MSKIGIHIVLPEAPEYRAKIIAARPAVLKIVGAGRDVIPLLQTYRAALGDGTTYIARLIDTEPMFAQAKDARLDPKQAAGNWAAVFRPFTQIAPWAYFEGLNEPVDGYDWLAQFDAYRISDAIAGGYRVTIGQFSVGNPKLPNEANDWAQYAPAVLAAKDAEPSVALLALHEYGPHGNMRGGDGFYVGRYRKVIAQGGIPDGVSIVFSEFGLDEPAWTQAQVEPKAYAAQLEDIDADLMADPRVVGAAVFTLDNSPGWSAYRIQGECADKLLAYIQASPRTIPAPTPAPQPAPVPLPAAVGAAVTTTRLNLRGGPSANDNILAVLPKGAELEIESLSGDWAKVVAYVNKHYLVGG